MTIAERVTLAEARLICAAKPMLEALTWLVNLGHGVGKAGSAPEPGEFEEALAAGKAAIAKAEGRD